MPHRPDEGSPTVVHSATNTLYVHDPAPYALMAGCGIAWERARNKKELLGNFYRNGKLYTRETIAVLDHDFPGYGDGQIIQHGVYDLGKNKAHVHLGISHDTTEFACDSGAHW